jgi:cobalt-zinc-cadmium efflux system outer membrane protein
MAFSALSRAIRPPLRPAASSTARSLRVAKAAVLTVAVLTAPGVVRGQGPQVDVENPPGSPTGRGSLGPALGASGTSGFDATKITSQESILGGRPGTSSKVAVNQLSAPQPAVSRIPSIARVSPLQAANVPQYGELELSSDVEAEEGPPDGLTIDAAINRLVGSNLNLLSLKYEIPMAQADVLTASLRNNPIFYADSQLVPYGHYSNQRPGGQTQYDVNVTLPLDVWRKRKARTIVAQRAKRVTEAQFQDAVRQQIDNLYTAYVDSLGASLTLKFSQIYANGLRHLLDLNEQLKGAGFIKPTDVLAIKARLELAELQIREATQTKAKTLRTLGLLLNIPPSEADKLQLRGTIFDVKPLPTTEEALIETGLNARPDLLSYRYGLLRAQADIINAKAQRFSDVYLLYQPYTLQDNTFQGLKSAYSYAFGVTVSLPVFNRNQGNILRSQLNADQSKFELANQEKQVVYDVSEAIREYDLSLNSVVEYKREVLPASKAVRDAAFRRWQGGETSALDYLEAQQDYNDVVRQYRDALVRHRRAMLDLNTAVGSRVIP